MARFYGAIGFAEQTETAPGVWRDHIVEREYKGDITRNTVRWNQGSEVNDELRIDNAISIISDPYSERHVSAMRYVTWFGQKWKITSAQIQRPRIILQLGGEYHEQVATASP